jgi:NTE family protein
MTKTLNLALQGGGSHGAYTWGVLDRLLEEEDVTINAISGSSAGAMNATILACGYRQGKREGAKQLLARFWQEVSVTGAFVNPIHNNAFDDYRKQWNLDGSFTYQMFDAMTRIFSPYQLNPFNLSPLRTILDNLIDPKVIQAGGEVSLFVTATNVHTGQPRVFRCHEVTVDCLLASACIPFFFQSVVIDGEPYWDGGYMGNPSIWPLIYNTKIPDVLLVQINPIYRPTTPTTANDIINRLNEISFNSSLIAEMRAINFVKKLIEEDRLDTDKYQDVNMHLVAAPDIAYGLNSSSKLNTSWSFLQYMKDLGRNAMEDWLKRNKGAIGHAGTVDIDEVFLRKAKPENEAKKKDAA